MERREGRARARERERVEWSGEERREGRRTEGGGALQFHQAVAEALNVPQISSVGFMTFTFNPYGPGETSKVSMTSQPTL